MYSKTNNKFILYSKELNTLIQKGLEIEFTYDKSDPYANLLIRGVVTKINHAHEISKLLEGHSLLVKNSCINYIIEDIHLSKSTISICDSYIELYFVGKLVINHINARVIK